MNQRRRLISKSAITALLLLMFSDAMGATVATIGTRETNNAAAGKIEKYQPLLLKTNSGEVGSENAQLKILALNRNEISELIDISKVWLAASDVLRRRVILTFEVLTKNRAFDKLQAAAVLKRLETSVPIETASNGSLESVIEKRLILSMAAKSGLLSTSRIEKEFAFIADAKRDSVERLGRAGALADAMIEDGRKPSIQQLKSLLQNDIFEVRMLAVDWHRLSPANDPLERAKFLEAALRTNPKQVTERAARACELDPSRVVREKCATESPSAGGK